jgi:ribonuclease R
LLQPHPIFSEPERCIPLGGKLNYMNFSIATLLSHFFDDKLIAPKLLEKKLGCEDEDSVAQLGIVLDVLDKIGVLEKDKGKFRRLFEEDVVEAKLRCSSKGFCFAIQDQEGAEDIYVRESHLSNAWNGDRVLIKVMKEGTRRRSPEGTVKLVLERANPSVLARLKQIDGGQYRAVPLDDRLLCELEVLSDRPETNDLAENLVQVEVLRHQIGQEAPLGRVAKVLGSSAEDASEIDIVCCKHDLQPEFPENVTQAALKLPTKVTAKMSKDRQDLTALTTFALAEEEERWENAFSLEVHEDGGWLAIVHIADVASYLEVDEYLDREARRRGTAVYVDRVFIPLLPPEVHLACALTSTAQRLAFSVALDVDNTGVVTGFEIYPSVVKVDHHLKFGQLEEAIAGKIKGLPKAAATKLKDLLQSVAPALREQRQAQGGLSIGLLECQTRFADEGRLGALFIDHPQSLVAELSIAANRAIASHLQALGVPAMYSIQYHPDLVEISDLLKLVQNLGLLPEAGEDAEEASPNLQQISQTFSQSSVKRVLNHILKSMLKTAIYSAQPGNHFGLGLSEGYLHAVSPLSRYADLLNQRVLHAVFADGRDRKSTRSKEMVDLHSNTCHGQISWNVLTPTTQQELAAQISGAISHLNDREKVAQDAENDLQGLQKAEQMRSRIGQVFQGLIVGVQSYGFFVEIEDFLVEGLVHVSSLKDDWYEFRPRYACLVGRKNRTTYRLGDQVEVEVKNVDYYRQQIDLVTVASTLAPPIDEETATEFEEI